MKPEEKARQRIDQLLQDAGWTIQDYHDLNLGASLGVAVRELDRNPESALDQFRGVVESLETKQWGGSV